MKYDSGDYGNDSYNGASVGKSERSAESARGNMNDKSRNVEKLDATWGIEGSDTTVKSEKAPNDDKSDIKTGEKNKKSKNSDLISAVSQFANIGFTMTASVLVGVLMGKYLDIWLGSSPWLLIIFSLLGGAAALRLIYNMSNNKNKK